MDANRDVRTRAVVIVNFMSRRRGYKVGEKQPEVIVVGAGIAGLTAAALPAKTASGSRSSGVTRCPADVRRSACTRGIGATLVSGFGRHGVPAAACRAAGFEPGCGPRGARHGRPYRRRPDPPVGDPRWRAERLRAFGPAAEPFWRARLPACRTSFRRGTAHRLRHRGRGIRRRDFPATASFPARARWARRSPGPPRPAPSREPPGCLKRFKRRRVFLPTAR